MVQPWVSDFTALDVCDIYCKIMPFGLVASKKSLSGQSIHYYSGDLFFSPLLAFMATSSIFIVITIFFLFELCISRRNGKMFTCITLLFQLSEEKLNASWHLAKIHQVREEKNRQLHGGTSVSLF